MRYIYTRNNLERGVHKFLTLKNLRTTPTRTTFSIVLYVYGLRPSREDNLGKNRLHDLLSVFRDATTNFLDGEVSDNAFTHFV